MNVSEIGLIILFSMSFVIIALLVIKELAATFYRAKERNELQKQTNELLKELADIKKQTIKN